MLYSHYPIDNIEFFRVGCQLTFPHLAFRTTQNNLISSLFQGKKKGGERRGAKPGTRERVGDFQGLKRGCARLFLFTGREEDDYIDDVSDAHEDREYVIA